MCKTVKQTNHVLMHCLNPSGVISSPFKLYWSGPPKQHASVNILYFFRHCNKLNYFIKPRSFQPTDPFIHLGRATFDVLFLGCHLTWLKLVPGEKERRLKRNMLLHDWRSSHELEAKSNYLFCCLFPLFNPDGEGKKEEIGPRN